MPPLAGKSRYLAKVPPGFQSDYIKIITKFKFRKLISDTDIDTEFYDRTCGGVIMCLQIFEVAVFTEVLYIEGDRGSTVVKVLSYKSEHRWFDPSCWHWNFSLT